jgi:hypothetical protein
MVLFGIVLFYVHHGTMNLAILLLFPTRKTPLDLKLRVCVSHPFCSLRQRRPKSQQLVTVLLGSVAARHLGSGRKPLILGAIKTVTAEVGLSKISMKTCNVDTAQKSLHRYRMREYEAWIVASITMVSSWRRAMTSALVHMVIFDRK